MYRVATPLKYRFRHILGNIKNKQKMQYGCLQNYYFKVWYMMLPPFLITNNYYLKLCHKFPYRKRAVFKPSIY